MSRTPAVVALILVLAGCGGSNSESSKTTQRTTTVEATQTTTEAKQMIVGSNVLGCLEHVGLLDVGQQEVGLWRGLHDDPAFAIVVRKLAKPVEAPIVVAGAYVKTGRFKVAAEGTELPNWGLEADFLVQEVADCLGS